MEAAPGKGTGRISVPVTFPVSASSAFFCCSSSPAFFRFFFLSRFHSRSYEGGAGPGSSIQHQQDWNPYTDVQVAKLDDARGMADFGCVGCFDPWGGKTKPKWACRPGDLITITQKYIQVDFSKPFVPSARMA